MPARPDIHNGALPHNPSHRILARLAIGGALPPVPKPKRAWPVQRACLAALVAVAAIIGAARLLAARPAAPDMALPPTMAKVPRPATAPGPAVVADERIPALAAPPAPPTSNAMPGMARARVAATPRQPAMRTATPARAKPPASRKEKDEDVALLAAMLEHANSQRETRPPKD